MKVSFVIGTRPQIIKSQPLIEELISKKTEVSIIHTGQHYDYKMSKTFFNEMKINEPDFHLGIKGILPVNQLDQIISKLEKPLRKLKPKSS